MFGIPCASRARCPAGRARPSLTLVLPLSFCPNCKAKQHLLYNCRSWLQAALVRRPSSLPSQTVKGIRAFSAVARLIGCSVAVARLVRPGGRLVAETMQGRPDLLTATPLVATNSDFDTHSPDHHFTSPPLGNTLPARLAEGRAS